MTRATANDVDAIDTALTDCYGDDWQLYRSAGGGWLASVTNTDGQHESFHAPTIGEALTAAVDHKFIVIVPPRPRPLGHLEAVKGKSHGRTKWQLAEFATGLIVAFGGTRQEALAREPDARARRQEDIDQWIDSYWKVTTDGVEGVDWKWWS